MDFKSLFYNQRHDGNSFITNLDGLLRTEPCALTIIPYASSNPISSQFSRYSPHRSFKLTNTSSNVSTFSLTFYPLRNKNENPLTGKVFILHPSSFRHTYLLLTIEPQEFVNRALIPFIEHNRPEIYMTLLDQNKLRFLLEEFFKKSGYKELKVVCVSWRSRVEPTDTRLSSVTWAKLGLEGAFAFAREQNGWFKSLNLELWNESRLCAQLNINREGIIKTNGDFNKIYHDLVIPLCISVQNGFDLTKNRGRTENPTLRARPLTLDFGMDIFKTSDETIAFANALKTMQKASVSLMHNNPYLHLSVVDYVDGSTFDLWIFGPRELTIVPQLKASIQGIRRLLSHIYDSFAEGQIKDFSHKESYATGTK